MKNNELELGQIVEKNCALYKVVDISKELIIENQRGRQWLTETES